MFANIHLLSLKEQKTGIQPLLDTRHSFNQLLMKLNYSASPVEDQLSLLQPLSCDQALSVCSPALKMCIRDSFCYIHDASSQSHNLVGWGESADASQWYIVEATDVEVTLNTADNASYATVYLPFAVSSVQGLSLIHI